MQNLVVSSRALMTYGEVLDNQARNMTKTQAKKLIHKAYTVAGESGPEEVLAQLILDIIEEVVDEVENLHAYDCEDRY